MNTQTFSVLLGSSTLPFLLVGQVVLIALAVRSAGRVGEISRTQAKRLYYAIGLLTSWALISGWLAFTGVYSQPAVLESLPGLWVTMMPVLILMVPWSLSASFRDSINAVVTAVGLDKVMLFEGLRVLAIGGIVKGVKGEFSQELAFYIGIPDLIFGTLSLVAAYLLTRGLLEMKWVGVLNLYGLLIIVPGIVVLMNLGIPGPWRIIHSTPNMVSMFEYPMALAPTAVVPTFIVINIFVINYLMSLRPERRPTASLSPQKSVG